MTTTTTELAAIGRQLAEFVERLAAVAPNLTEIELRVLVQLAALAEGAATGEAAMAPLELCHRTRLGCEQVVAALEALNAKDLIASTGGYRHRLRLPNWRS